MKMLKLLLCALLMALPVFAEEVEDRQTATSLHYVSHELDTRQNKLSAGSNKALTYTNAAGNVLQRDVKANLNGGTTDTSLPQVNAVNAGLDSKQDDISVINDHTAVTYTEDVGTIGQKGIYQDTGTYAEQMDNLIDAKTFNAALKNGLDSEFVCADTPDAYSPTGECWLWQIHTGTERLLPPEYTQLEYIVFNGTQELDTGFTANQDTKIMSKFFGTANNFTWVYGTGESNPRITCFLAPTGNERFGNVTVDSTGISMNVLTEVVQDKNGFSVNGMLKAYSNVGTFNCTNTLAIGNSKGQTGTPRFEGNFYYMKVYDNNVLARDYVPAMNSNDVGLYDVVNDTFLTDVGLVAGPAAVNTNIYIPQNQQ